MNVWAVYPNRIYTLTPPDWDLIPDHMHQCVADYIERGILQSRFLEAVVTNDLTGAVLHADEINRTNLHNYVKFFYQHTPMVCWGSPQNVQNWINQKGLDKGEEK